MKRVLAVVIVLWAWATCGTAQEFVIKFATVAPEGSTWMNIMRQYDAAVRKESGGRIGFRIYPGQVMGDESSVLRKIRVGQLQAGGFTGVGLGDVAPVVRILDTPFLVNSADESDHVCERSFMPPLGQRFFGCFGKSKIQYRSEIELHPVVSASFEQFSGSDQSQRLVFLISKYVLSAFSACQTEQSRLRMEFAGKPC